MLLYISSGNPIRDSQIADRLDHPIADDVGVVVSDHL
jgi:hypothetical protein